MYGNTFGSIGQMVWTVPIPADQASTDQLLYLQDSLLTLREAITISLQELREMEAKGPMDSDYYAGLADGEQVITRLDADLRKLGITLESRKSAAKIRERQGLWARLWSWLKSNRQPGR